MRHLLNPLDFSVEEIDDLLALARDIESNLPKYAHVCDGKKLATLFYEPSTRTRLSFEAAMLNLGGNVLGFSSANSSSASKGESVADTIRMISCYADICAMRHPKEGAAYVAAQKARIPVINAGDGGHQHPTQTLTDLMTIRSLKGRLDNLTIGLCGDLKFGRTVHSLINAMVRYPGVKFVLISPPELRIPDSIREDVLIANNIPFEEIGSLDDSIGTLDILYMTRVQKERFFNEEDYIRLKDCYILDKKRMAMAKDDMFVLHPLPRVNEISVEVDDDPRAAYFRQAQYGVYVRMALIMTLLEVARHTSSCMCVGNNSAYPWASPLRGQRKRCSKRLAVLSGNSKYLGYIPNVIIAMGCRIKPNGARGLSPPSNRALPRDRSASVWTVSPSMRCALTAVAGPAVGALINPLYRTAQGVTGVIRPFSPPGCTASPAPGSPPPER